jgi:pilus assembly protein CpaB
VSGKLIIMAGLAVAFGATSYVGGNYYLESQTQALTEARINELDANRPVVEAVELAKVVVATSEIKFGEAINSSNIKVVDWPQDAFPEGAFTATSEVISDGNRRVLTTIFPGEPIITAKITGENGRAGLSGIIAEGMRAVTVPVNTVNGVGGFIQPGDRVDILLTKNDNEDDSISSTTLMEYVKILSVDQNAGSRNETAQVASSVTIETDANGAKKIAWGLNVGTLSLTLRGAGDAETAKASDSNGDSLFTFEEDKPTRTSIKVVSGDSIKEYNVAIEGAKKPENQNNNNN